MSNPWRRPCGKVDIGLIQGDVYGRIRKLAVFYYYISKRMSSLAGGKKMGRIFTLIFCFALLTLFSVKGSEAETGKCVVTDVAGNKMVIECNQEPKGFDKGAKIKIKTEKKKSEDGK